MQTYITLKKLKDQITSILINDNGFCASEYESGRSALRDEVLELIEGEIKSELKRLVEQDTVTSGKKELNEPILPDDYPIHAGYAYVFDGRPDTSNSSGTVGQYKRANSVLEIRRFDMYGREDQKKARERVLTAVVEAQKEID